MEQEIKRGPGRPKYHEAVAAQAPVVDVVTDAPASRPARKPFGTLEQKMNYPARPGFHRHWFNDVPGRLERALEAGYAHVQDNSGKNVSMIVGTAPSGGPLHGFLMEIPEAWFQEDMKAQQKDVDAKEDAMRRGALESQEGDGRYVPAQGIKITHG